MNIHQAIDTEGAVPARKLRIAPETTTKTLNLALQGGGAHGAFTWGVLVAFSKMSGSTSKAWSRLAPVA